MFAECLEKIKKQTQLIFNKCKTVIAEKTTEMKKHIEVASQNIEEKAKTAGAVAKIQGAMAKRRVLAMVDVISSQIDNKVKHVHTIVKSKYNSVREMWCGNQHFTFWLIPADGHNIAKKHVKKTHLKYAFTGVAAFLVVVSTTIGVLAHFAIQNEAQKKELAEYKATKQAQEQKIQELQQIAEKNQKQLAYLSKLEDQVRSEMEKTGASLPPKNDAYAYAGKGGPSLGNASVVSIMLEEEKNIQNQAKAKESDLQNLLSAIESENYRREVTPSCWPTSGGYISSSFGGRYNPFDGYSSDWHPGIDIANDYGAPVYASASGYVEQAGWYGGYGRYVRLAHDFGYETAYGHMSSIAVSSGDYVKKGEIIGYIGSSGYSTGPHLHFEVIKNDEQVNPSNLM